MIVALSRWGARFLDAPHEGDELRAGWAAVAMLSALGARGGNSGTYELRIDGAAFGRRKEGPMPPGRAPPTGARPLSGWRHGSWIALPPRPGAVSLEKAAAS